MQKGLIHVYYGDGKGKTTAAIGLGIRACGNDMKVPLVQFLKANDSCELVTLRKIRNFSLGDAPCSLPFWFNMNERQKSDYRRYAAQLFEAAVKTAASLDVLILDEVLDAVNMEVLPEKSLLDFLDNKPEKLEVVLTGHSKRKSIPSSTVSPRAKASSFNCIRGRKRNAVFKPRFLTDYSFSGSGKCFSSNVRACLSTLFSSSMSSSEMLPKMSYSATMDAAL